MGLERVIGGIFDKVKDRVPSAPTDGVLSHYTSLEVLAKFLEEYEDVCLTSCLELNDASEVWYGLKEVVRPSLCDAFKGGRNDEIEKCVERAEQLLNVGCGPWLMSFSCGSDSLVQWQAYTDHKEGGCSVGFSYERLRRRIKEMNGLSPDRTFLLLPCVYTNEERDSLVSALIGDCKSTIDKIHYSTGSAQATQVDSVARILLCCAAMIKDERFREEKEWRLILIREPTDRSFRPCLVGGKLRVASGISEGEYGLAKYMEQVLYSPRGNRRNFEFVLRQMLNGAGRFHVMVNRSCCPLQ